MLLLFSASFVVSPQAALAASAAPGYQGMGAGSGGALTLSVPYVSQLAGVPGFGWRVADYACGPASAAMVAAYWAGTAPPLGRAERAMGGTALIGVGSAPWQVAQTIRQLAPGVAADTANAGGSAAALSVLRAQLAQGRPVIALVHPSWFYTPINHFVVVTGLDPFRHMVIFHDPIMGADVQESEQGFLAAWANPRQGRPYTYVWAAGNAAASFSQSAAGTPATTTSGAPLSETSFSSGSSGSPGFAAGEWVNVVPTGLRVHTGPSVADTVVAYLAQGDQAQVIAVSEGWVRLRRYGRTLGWVNGSFLTPS